MTLDRKLKVNWRKWAQKQRRQFWDAIICKFVGHVPEKVGTSRRHGQYNQEVVCTRCHAEFWGPIGWPLSRFRRLIP